MLDKIDFDKGNGLIPAIIQCSDTRQVLMLGYMNQQAYLKSVAQGRVTFYSRSKKSLWTKGETSGNFLDIVQMSLDCDGDTLLILVKAPKAVCHKGTKSCFTQEISLDNSTSAPNNLDRSSGFTQELEQIIALKLEQKQPGSYTYALQSKGIAKVAQKVGEEAVELVIEAMSDSKELFLNEAADLLYHYLLLIKVKGYSLTQVEQILKQRHLEKESQE